MLDTHIGTKNIWSGTIRTLCGQTLPPCEWVWEEPTCPECQRLKKTAKRWWY